MTFLVSEVVTRGGQFKYMVGYRVTLRISENAIKSVTLFFISCFALKVYEFRKLFQYLVEHVHEQSQT